MEVVGNMPKQSEISVLNSETSLDHETPHHVKVTLTPLALETCHNLLK